MDERWTEIDLPAVLARASQPVFLLNERDRLVFANPALHDLFQLPAANRIGWRDIEAGPLKPPADLPAGGSRQLDVRIPDGRWMQVVFHSLQDVHAGSIGVLGVLRPSSPIPVVAVSDANLFPRWERLREDQRLRFGFDVCPARGAIGLRLLQQLKIAATIDSSALFLGESGVGKLTLAKVLHYQIKDRGWSAVLDAEALDPDQQHDFLFGDRGALSQGGPGRLILRRPSLLAFNVQKELMDAHSAEDRRWRLLATDRDPVERAVSEGRLHPSLYFALTTFTIAAPPLRERKEDVADFVALLLDRRQMDRGGMLPIPTAAALAALEGYEWPGNLRELSMAVESAAHKAAGGALDVPHLPPRIVRGTLPPSRSESVKPPPLDELLERLERRMLRQAYSTFRGNKSKAAEHLGLSRARFIRRWDQLKMDSATAADRTTDGPEDVVDDAAGEGTG
jgi:PAS domain-containing protein